VLLRLDPGAGEGIVAWTLSGAGSPEVDGLAVAPPADPDAAAKAPLQHANGVAVIDHVVILTDDLGRTAEALEGAGAPLRRTREADSPFGPVRQGFFRLGEVILEAVEPRSAGSGAGGARFWGITFATADLDRCAKLLGDRLGRIRAAVQPGRRIAPVRREAGLGVALAFITPGERGVAP
jgi:hypothetical protein